MNYKKLAELASVSVGTVSKAFKNSKEISEKTKQTIFEIAKETGCFDKYYKCPRQTKAVAIIIPELVSEIYYTMASYIQTQLKERGIISLVSSNDFKTENTQSLISYFNSTKSVDGIIIIDARLKNSPDGVPIVNLSTIKKSGNHSAPAVYDQMIKLFKQNGHKKIAYIGEKLTRSKQLLFTEAMNNNLLHVDSDYIVESDKRFEQAGYEAMEQLYSLPSPPTAIFAAYDYIALGAMQCIKNHGHSVPEDFSIVGSDDISFASHSNISLSSIRTDSKAVCDVAIDLVIKKFDRKYLTLKSNIFQECELIIRNSIKNLNEKR